jgi:hypothetical protein
MRLGKALTLLAASVWSASLVTAQVTTATVYVIVTDTSAGVVPQSTAVLTEQNTGAVRRQTCDENGECKFTFLSPGLYTASIGASGFKTLEVSGLKVDAGENIRRTFALPVGDIVEKVSVAGEAPIVNTVSPEQWENTDSATLTQLPTVNRMASQLFQIGTAVIRVGGTSNTTGSFQMNGLGAGAASFTMDGVPASAHPGDQQAGFRGGFSNIEIASMEAIQEVQVTKGVFSAEYSRTMSGNINVITKSGTNQWHGSLFELFNAEQLNARQVFLKTRPASTSNQYGGSLGGPILKNRVFIFGVYEGYHDVITTTINGTVPTPSLRASMIAAFPAYAPMVNEFFLPNQAYAPTAATATFTGAGVTKARDNHFEIKPDVLLTNTSKLTGTWVRDRPIKTLPLGPATDYFEHFTGAQDRVSLTFTTFHASWSAETRWGWNRADDDRLIDFYNVKDPAKAETLPGQRRVPGISALGMSINGGDNCICHSPEWNFEQKMIWQLGRHSLKFGGQIYRHRFGEGDLEDSTFSYNTAQDLIANTPSSGQFNFGFQPWVGKQLDFGLFVQDDWRVNRKLVLNIGLRYDYFNHLVAEGLNGGFPRLVNAGFTNFANFTLTPFRPFDNPYDSSNLNMGPRFGFAYNPDGHGKAALRGGIGMMRDPVSPSIFEQTGINAVDEPFRVTLTKNQLQSNNLIFPVYNEDLIPLVKQGIVPPAYALVDPHIHPPYSINYTLGIQYAFTNTLMLESSFVGTRGVHLIQVRWYNQPDPITGLPPNPSAGSNKYWDNSDSSNYNAWQTSVRKRYSKNFSGSLHYTWGKAITYGFGDITYSLPGASYIQQGDFFNIRNNRGRPPQDVTHAIVGNWVYNTPLLGNSNRLIRNTLGGWEATGIFTAQTGQPLTVTQASASVYGRPDIINPNVILNQGLQYLNPAAFRAVPTSAVSGEQIRAGSEGWGAQIGPGLWNVDFSLGKNFQIIERLRFQFRADMLNSLNHPNLTSINTNVSSGQFGQRTGATNPRAVQFHLRLSF